MEVYRMPEVYDRPGGERGDDRIKKAMERYKDDRKGAEEEATPWAEQAKWESEQINKSKAQFGAKDRVERGAASV